MIVQILDAIALLN